MKKTILTVSICILASLFIYSCGAKAQKSVVGNGIYVKTQSGYQLIIGENTPVPHVYESRIDGDAQGMELTLAQYQNGAYKNIFSKTIVLDAAQTDKGQPTLRIELNPDGRAVISVVSAEGKLLKTYKGIIFR
jgi:hypothetical protein